MSEKKRKMIDVDPAVVEMFARVLQKLKPPPKLTISEWADRFRQMSPEASAGTGRWHTDNAPYQREIMDAIGNPHVRMVVFKSSSQVGKTEVLLNVLGYYIDYNPAPILALQPTVEMGQTFSKDRLAPMIRDTAVLRKKMDAKSRFSGNTIMQKTFPGGHVTIVGANSPAGLASRPIKIVLADEVDRYPVSAGTEGDPLNLAQTRQTTFWDKKTVLVSTPTIKGSSRIEKSWLESTMEEWTVPCPECGEYQPMVWANVVFDRERWPRGGVQYRCESCGCIAGEYRWKAQGRKGRYAALHPEREVRGFHLNVLASSFCAWAGIVTEFLSAKEALDHGNPELMKVWVNTKLGETWEERGETADDMALLARREMYTATVPAQVLVLTCGIDVQDDRFELELVGWGVGKESWGIRYQMFHMNSSDSNSGGWNGSYMRKTLLGNSNTPASTLENSLMAALPSDLLAVMKTVTKYTDNTGGGSNSSGNVTATADYLFLLAEFEVFGTRYWANQYEQNSQKQYDYYKAGNSRVAYNHSAVSTAVWWWLRSAYYGYSGYFCGVTTDGGCTSYYAYYSAGLRPGFAV